MSNDFLDPGYDRYSDKTMTEFKNTIKTSFDSYADAANVFESEEAFEKYCKDKGMSGVSVSEFCNMFATEFGIDPNNINEVLGYLVDTTDDDVVDDAELAAFAAGMYELQSADGDDDGDGDDGPTAPPSTVIGDDKHYVPVSTDGWTVTEQTRENAQSRGTVTGRTYTDESGTVRREDTVSYSSGRVTKSVIYDENGKILREEKYNSRGEIESVVEYTDGVKSGEYKFNRDGYATTETRYSAGSVTESHQYSYSGGQVTKDVATVNGKKTESAYENGQLKSTKTFDGNSLTEIKFYGSDGKVSHIHKVVTVDGRQVFEVCDKNGKSKGEYLTFDGQPYTPVETPERLDGTTDDDAPKFDDAADRVQGTTKTPAQKAQLLYDAMEPWGYTDEQTVYNILYDENLTGAELMEIMREFNKISPDKSLCEWITGDFSYASKTPDGKSISEQELTTRMYKLLQEEADKLLESGDITLSSANESKASKFHKVFTETNVCGIGHGDVTGVLGSDDEALALAAIAYSQTYGTDFMKGIYDESWYGSQETYIDNVIDSYFKLLDGKVTYTPPSEDD